MNDDASSSEVDTGVLLLDSGKQRFDVVEEKKDDMLLYVFSNVSLKLYDVHLGSNRTPWTPTLHSTEEQCCF